MTHDELHQQVTKYRFEDELVFYGWGEQTDFPKELVSLCSECCIYGGLYIRSECFATHKHGKGISFCPKGLGK